jgi:hypothetical protein
MNYEIGATLAPLDMKRTVSTWSKISEKNTTSVKAPGIFFAENKGNFKTA